MEILIYNSPAERKFLSLRSAGLVIVLLFFGQWFVLYKHFANYVLRIFSDMPLIFFASGSFRENTDGNSGFYFVYCGQDRFESLFDVFPVKEETVEITHPCGKKRNFLHLFFGNVACTDRTAGVSKKYVEVASVVADIKYRCVLWHIFFSDHSNLCTGDLKDKSEYCLDDPKGADILLFRRKSADDPFDQQDGDGQDQVSDHNNTD